MIAIANFALVAALLLLQDHFMPSSARMVANLWMGGDVDGFYASYRARFRRRLIVLLVGSTTFAVGAWLEAPDWAQILLLLTAFISHGSLTIFDIVKSRRF